MRFRRVWLVASVMALVVLLSAGTSSATTVTHYFSGVMNDPFGNHPIGTPFSGSITYDDSQTDISPGSPTLGNYLYQNFTVTVGGDTVSDAGALPGQIYVRDNLVTPYPTDLLIASTGNIVGTVGGLTLAPNGGLQLALQDLTGTAFTGIGLPGPNLTLNDLTPGNATFIQLQTADFNNFARGELLWLNVPEPSTALLAIAGLLPFVAWCRQRQRAS